MKKSVVFLAFAVLFYLSPSAFAEEYIVKYKDENVVQKLLSLASKSAGLYVKDVHPAGQLAQVELVTELSVQGKMYSTAGSLAALRNDPNVDYVVPNTKIRLIEPKRSILDMKELKKQYALTKVNAPQAWARAGNKGNRSIVVAVLDTGVDFNHKNLAGNMIQGYDFYSDDLEPMDETAYQKNQGHGTHCSGIIGANGLVDKGIVGISPDVSIMPLRFMGASGMGTLYNAIRAIDYAISKKVDVISSSWSASMSPESAQPLIEAVKRADRAGIIHVMAAANDGKNNDKYNVYPANVKLPGTIVVAASSASDGKPSWSNYGTNLVTLAAPGDNIMSTLPKDRYDTMSGTSMATPLVAGLVAFLKAQDSTLSGAEMKALLQSTGTQVKIQTACNCRIDAFKAVDTLLSKKPWLVPAAETLKVGESAIFSMKNANGAVKFAVSNTKYANIDPVTGALVAKAKGKVIVTATDVSGQSASTAEIQILK